MISSDQNFPDRTMPKHFKHMNRYFFRIFCS